MRPLIDSKIAMVRLDLDRKCNVLHKAYTCSGSLLHVDPLTLRELPYTHFHYTPLKKNFKSLVAGTLLCKQ